MSDIDKMSCENIIRLTVAECSLDPWKLAEILENVCSPDEEEYTLRFQDGNSFTFHINPQNPVAVRAASVWERYFQQYPPTLDQWFPYWHKEYTIRHTKPLVWEKAFLEVSWKVVFRATPSFMKDNLGLIVHMMIPDMLEIGALLNILMDTCDQQEIARVYQMMGDILRSRGMNLMACVFYNQLEDGMKTIGHCPRSDHDIMNHAVSHFYLRFGDKTDAMRRLDNILMRLIPIPSHDMVHALTQLQYWYHPRLTEEKTLNAVCADWTPTIRHAITGFHPSSCSLVGTRGILRCVNYRIVRENGSYEFENGIVKTENFWVSVNPMTAELVVNATVHMDIPQSFRKRDAHITGLEDMRMFQHWNYPDRIYALATTFDYGKSTNQPSQVFCVFNADTLSMDAMYVLDYENNQCQKNWIPVVIPNDDAVYIIYGWRPYTILRINMRDDGHPETVPGHPGEALLSVHYEKYQHGTRVDTFRGSTCPTQIGKEWHIIVHEVYYTEDSPTRKYRHRVVRLSSDLKTIAGISHPFVFEDNQIEYTIGMTRVGDFILLHYSVWDNHSKLMSIPIDRWVDWIHHHS